MTIWMGWLKRESGSAGYSCCGDKGRAYGAYQFDYRYALVDFLKMCVQAGLSEFSPYSKLSKGNASLVSNASLKALFVKYSKQKKFCDLQDQLAKQNYYEPAAAAIKKLGIDPDQHSAVFRGSLFSMAIRSGASIGAKKMNQSGTEEQILRKAYATYGNEDAKRWTESGQLGDALKALEEEQKSEDKTVLYDVTKLIQIAKGEIGYLEKKSNANLDSKTGNAGSGNYTKYWRDLKSSYQGQPWCDCFVDWCFVKAYGKDAASRLECGGTYEFYTPTSAQKYKDAGQWYTKPKTGDQIFFKNSSRICHTGIVISVTDKKVTTIEGNTSGANGLVANGGGVCQKTYTIGNSYIAGYGRPNYGSNSGGQSERILKKGMKGSDVKQMQQDLISLGYSCGAAGADGDFGSATDKALKAFQKDQGLVVDGEYGSMSKEAMEKVKAKKSDNAWKATGTAIIVNATFVNMRSEPKKGDNVIRVLKKGNRFEIDGKKSGKWIHARTSDDGKIGWLHVDYVQKD